MRYSGMIGACLLLAGLLPAQENASSSLANSALETHHIIKTNLGGYALYSINANYEYRTGINTSVGLLGGYKLPSTYTVDAIGDLGGDTQTYTGEIEPKGFFLNPYFRVYPSGAMSGFFLEAFTRYYSFEFQLPYDYTKNGSDIRAYADGTAKAFGGGIALGAQFALAKHLFMDIHAGFGVANGNIHMETNDPNLDAADYLEIKQNIEEFRDDADVQIFLLNSVFENIEADANESSAWADINNQLFPVFRGGICIGYGF